MLKIIYINQTTSENSQLISYLAALNLQCLATLMAHLLKASTTSTTPTTKITMTLMVMNLRKSRNKFLSIGFTLMILIILDMILYLSSTLIPPIHTPSQIFLFFTIIVQKIIVIIHTVLMPIDLYRKQMPISMQFEIIIFILLTHVVMQQQRFI